MSDEGGGTAPDAATPPPGEATFVLVLYITGLTPRSRRAIEHVRTICETHLTGRYDLQIIDIYQQPALAQNDQILAAPTLIKRFPLPLRRLIGDMSNAERVLAGLELSPLT